MRAIGVLVILVALGFVGTVDATGPYVNSDGYWVYPSSSYYWKGNDAYVRIQVPGYYSYGYYYPQTYRYQFSYTYAAPVTSYTAPLTPSVGWRTQLLNIAAARDKAEAKIRLEAFEQQYYLDAVKALGLQGNFKWNNYGAAPPYLYGAGHSYGSYGPAYGNLQLSTAGAQGQTIYGYSYNSIASLYGDANLGTLYQQANRLAENAQKLAGQAASDFTQLAGTEGSNRARVAEILAKGQAVQEMLRAMQGSGSTTQTKVFTFKVGPGADGGMKVEKIEQVPPPMPPVDGAAVPKDVKAAWVAHATTKCAGCHSGKKVEGGFDVASYPTLPLEAKLTVVGRLLTTDPSKRMPKGGDKLTTDEMRLWLSN